jgi:hypothetical protein
MTGIINAQVLICLRMAASLQRPGWIVDASCVRGDLSDLVAAELALGIGAS